MNVARQLLTTATLTVAVLGCAPASPSRTPLAVTIVPVDGTYSYAGIAWSDDQFVAARAELADGGDEYRLVEIDASDGSVLDERKPDPTGCQRLDENAPSNVGGRLAWVSSCIFPAPGLQQRFEVMTAAGLRGDVIVLSSVVIDGYSIRALDVRDDSILTSYGSRTCETLARLGVTEVEPISIAVSGPGGDFNTGFRLDHGNCVDTGVAILPSTNRDGALAFMASTRAIGRDGPARLDPPFDLYVVPRGESAARLLGFSLSSPSLLTWTPKAEALIAGGRIGAEIGTWRVDPSSGSATRILDFRMESPSWSTDGKRLVAMRGLEANQAPEIVVIDTQELVGGDSQ